MKFLIAVLTLLTLPLTDAKEFVIENTFAVDLPDDSASTVRPEGSIPNIGYPKLHNSEYQFMMYWWNWVQPGVEINDVPRLWEARRENHDKQVSGVQPFDIDSGLSGVKFQTIIHHPDRQPFKSDMLLLQDSSGRFALFQMAGDQGIIESAFRSLRYKNVEQGAAANP